MLLLSDMFFEKNMRKLLYIVAEWAYIHCIIGDQTNCYDEIVRATIYGKCSALILLYTNCVHDNLPSPPPSQIKNIKEWE